MSIQQNPENPILIIDDEPMALESFETALEFLGFDNVLSFQDAARTMSILEEKDVEIVLLDIIMPGKSGESLLEEINLKYPDIPVIMTTGVDDIQTVVRCLRKGAFDYLTKPVDAEQFASSIKRALDYRQLKRQNELLFHHILTDNLKAPEAFSSIITRNKKMLNLFMYCEAIARGKEPVLITGETGVGKELFAQAIYLSGARRGEFVPVNVAGLDDHVFSDTLFGHKRGAFTGAAEPRKGFIEKANGGTIFLDEIGDLVESSQIKLLRVIQDREYFPLGSDQPRPVDAHIIVATNKDLKQLCETGGFRQDLYYRLRTHHFRIPSLRERLEDVPLLLEYYLEVAAREFGKPIPTYPPELPKLLMTYNFPGNVRELRAMVYDAVGKHTSKVMSMKSFRENIDEGRPSGSPPSRTKGRIFESFEELPTLKEASSALIEEALLRAGGNQRIASALLGMSPSAFNRRIKTGEC